jgi:pyrroline-5-carboxylate reductase
MMEAGQALGLEAAVARRLTLQTLKGALALLDARQASPETLRAQVTSPGGTTEAALNVLQAADVKSRLVEAITAAARRSQALSRI